ncbi:hypothetical protein COCVIDRAFT_36941 [Bipolaris victoriae FI3]|uniref:Sulfite efflux pump SSU1 n=1 Tax=Bipolaris victoriae (strain FI3) TaxID=930091 RepID=W7EJ01_BIPV3|nr:hypothetical protein COCVIDRAFT_36941 [Bipolaris victoriae FI3]
MDEYELDRVGTNNPALCPPTSQGIAVQRSKSRNSRATNAPSGSNDDVIPEEEDEYPSKYDVGWRRIVRNFSPSWFSVTTGTGVVSLLFISIPFQAPWLYWLSVFFFGLNTLLFACALLISIFRYVAYPEIWPVMIADSANSLFLGTVPMGFSTLISAWCSLCIPYWGSWAVTFAWVCWMLDAAVAVAVTISLTVLLISASRRQALDKITAAQLLPISASVVASGAGARVAEHLINPEHALGTILASYIMWGMSVPLSLTVIVMYYTRLALHKLPPREIIVSSFLPLGPLGLGGYAVVRLGSACRRIFPQTGSFSDIPIAGDVFFVIGIFTALIMWSFGLTWLCFALASIYKSRPIPFSMGWWGFTFPLGVFALSTIELGHIIPSMFFRVLGTIFSISVIILWCVVFVGTVRGAWTGHLFYAPCLKNIPKKQSTGTDTAEQEQEIHANTASR